MPRRPREEPASVRSINYIVGRGNASRAVVVSGRLHGKNGVGPVPENPIIESVRFLRCTVDGELACEDVAQVDLTGTVFTDPRGQGVHASASHVG